MSGARSVFYETKRKLRTGYGREAEPLSYILLDELFGLSRVDIIVDKKFVPGEEQANRLDKIINRLINREPIQYILGKTTFLDRTFTLEPGVLNSCTW